MSDRSVKRKAEGSSSRSITQAQYRTFIGELRSHMIAKEKQHEAAIKFERYAAKIEAYEDMQARITNLFAIEKSKIDADMDAWAKEGMVDVPPVDWAQIGEDNLDV